MHARAVDGDDDDDDVIDDVFFCLLPSVCLIDFNQRLTYATHGQPRENTTLCMAMNNHEFHPKSFQPQKNGILCPTVNPRSYDAKCPNFQTENS